MRTSITVILLLLCFFPFGGCKQLEKEAKKELKKQLKEAEKKEHSKTPSISGSSHEIGGRSNLALGNPSNAKNDTSNPENYLIERKAYALSYNRDRGIPNWVSWELRGSDLGSLKR